MQGHLLSEDYFERKRLFESTVFESLLYYLGLVLQSFIS